MTTRLRRFWRDERGAGTVFMVAMLPVFLALAGLAIDSANAYRMRNILQGAADAAAMAATLALPDSNAATAAAVAYAKLNLPNHGNVLVAADVQTGNWDPATHTFKKGGTPVNSVRVTTRLTAANGNAVPTTFLNIIGIDHWDVAAQSTAAAEQPKLWIALALDNTGSMCEPDNNPCAKQTVTDPKLLETPGDYHVADIKINAVKVAAFQLLNILQAAVVNEGDIRVSIVPFARNVNVGTAAKTANWLSFDYWKSGAPALPGADKGPGTGTAITCPWSKSVNGFQCQSTPVNTADSYQSTGTTIPTSGTYKGYICPSLDEHGHYYNGCYTSTTLTKDKQGRATSWTHKWVANNTSTWSGCVTDRDQDFDVLTTAPTSAVPASLFPADNSPSCPAATLMGLTTDWTTLKGKVASMTSNGSTNQTIGMVWAWQSLQQGAPMNAPQLPRGTRRIIILLSDGLNTQNRWSGNGSSNSAQADARMAKACSNIKADGIEIYTIFTDINGKIGRSAVLADCASGANHYYNLTTTGGIVTAFEDIGRRVLRMRLVH